MKTLKDVLFTGSLHDTPTKKNDLEMYFGNDFSPTVKICNIKNINTNAII